MPDTKKETRLQKLRKNSEFTQEQLASFCDVTVKTYRSWEKDPNLIPCRALKILKSIFDKSIDYIVEESNCGSIENDYIQKEIGLTDKAIDALRSNHLNNKYLRYFLSVLLTNKHLFKIMMICAKYICSIAGKTEINYSRLYSSEDDIISYLSYQELETYKYLFQAQIADEFQSIIVEDELINFFLQEYYSKSFCHDINGDIDLVESHPDLYDYSGIQEMQDHYNSQFEKLKQINYPEVFRSITKPEKTYSIHK